MSLFAKMKGQAKPLPPKIPAKQVAIAWLGGLIAISAIGLLVTMTGQEMPALIMGSFGASCVILFGIPEAPFAQPRNVILGHFISTFIGLFFLHFVGPDWWSMALALATALAAMQLTRTVHPPAGSNPIIVFLAGAGWEFLLMPSTLGSIILVVVALIYNNLSKDRHYPSYW